MSTETHASEALKATHEAIKAFLPSDCYVVVEHSLRGYSDGEYIKWACQVYESDQVPMESLFMIHQATSISQLIDSAKEEYEKYLANTPSTTEKIAALEKQIAKLRGE